MINRIKSPWKKIFSDTALTDQQQQQQSAIHDSGSVSPCTSSGGSSSTSSSSISVAIATTSASTSGISHTTTATAITSGSDSSNLKTTKEKTKIISVSSNFRKLRKKLLRNKKETADGKEENTEFEKVAVRQRPARSKKKSKSALKWKEGMKPVDRPSSAEENKEKKKYRPKKKKRKIKKQKKLKSSKSFTSTLDEKLIASEAESETEKEPKQGEKDLKMTERDETETETEADELPNTEAKDDEFEPESARNETENAAKTADKKKKEPRSSGTSMPPARSPKSPDLPLSIIHETGPSSACLKESEEYITPLISTPNHKPTFLVAAETAASCTSCTASSSISHKSNNGSTTASEYEMMLDLEPIILSTPACQVLGIIMKKQLFKNAAPTEAENDLIRMYFAGKIPPGRAKDAQETLEKAVDLAVTRVKSSGISEDLYQFLNNNRLMAISLMIDAMKYRKEEFLPEFWNYDRKNKKEPPTDTSTSSSKH
uniref:Uncharacterized protein n=1 Tax=Setaria digitata TaxID=48799 RepID=A0A915PZ13_9BILA